VIVILRVLALTCILLGGSSVRAEVGVPPLTVRVTDLTTTLTRAQVQALEETLKDFETRKGRQLAVLIVRTTQPETIEQYGIRVAEQWKLGRKGIDDGAILIVAKHDRTLRIEVGYGLEGVLNDATAKRIVSDTIVPRFRQGDFAGGIREGVDRMISVIEGEPLPEPAADSTQEGSDLRHYALVALLFAFFMGGFLRSILGRLPGGLVTGGVLAYLAWLVSGAVSVALVAALIGFAVTLFGGGLIRPMIGGIAGGRSRGTGFGTGLGGFRGGGGGFGGGGASGRW
jgi:uncharacterized protein